MNEEHMRSILRHLTEQKAPQAEIDLWPKIETRIKTGALTETRGFQMKTRQQRNTRLAAAAALAVVLAGILFFTSAQGQVWAQSLLRFFTRSESDQLPLQSWQLTPQPRSADPTDDPASILSANPDIEDVQRKAGFDILIPAWIPESFEFAGASIDQEQKIVRIFYRTFMTNGLGIRQERIPSTDTCELCAEVGAGAAVEEVSIDGNYGEYVVGVWKLTDDGPVWEPDPYLQTMRWQEDGMAFEMLYMGDPEMLSMEDMVAIAESMK